MVAVVIMKMMIVRVIRTVQMSLMKRRLLHRQCQPKGTKLKVTK